MRPDSHLHENTLFTWPPTCNSSVWQWTAVQMPFCVKDNNRRKRNSSWKWLGRGRVEWTGPGCQTTANSFPDLGQRTSLFITMDLSTCFFWAFCLGFLFPHRLVVDHVSLCWDDSFLLMLCLCPQRLCRLQFSSVHYCRNSVCQI